MVDSMKKLKKTSLILLFSMSVFIMTCGPLFVQAYELMGPIWASIYTDPLRYYDTSGYGEVSTATSDWNNAVSDITLSTGPSSCIYKIIKADDSDVDWDGETDWAAAFGFFYKCDVYINHFYVKTYNSDVRKSVIGHEMGHAFGLDDRTNVGVIMNGATYGAGSRCGTYSIYTPQADDANGVDYLY